MTRSRGPVDVSMDTVTLSPDSTVMPPSIFSPDLVVITSGKNCSQMTTLVDPKKSTRIVGYSKLSTNEQHARLGELNRIVRDSEQFRKAQADNHLLKIPTGDGMALVFYN